jgi:hypothetical protein
MLKIEDLPGSRQNKNPYRSVATNFTTFPNGGRFLESTKKVAGRHFIQKFIG